jgi:hypothetical protein
MEKRTQIHAASDDDEKTIRHHELTLIFGQGNSSQFMYGFTCTDNFDTSKNSVAWTLRSGSNVFLTQNNR